MGYVVGIDIGGTFTDCAIVDRAGRLLTTKVPSTPEDFSRGMMDALGAGAKSLGLSLDDFCRDIAFLCSAGATAASRSTTRCASRPGTPKAERSSLAICCARRSPLPR